MPGFDGRRAHELGNEARCNVVAAVLDESEVLHRAGFASASARGVKALRSSP